MSQYFDNKELFLGASSQQYGSHMVMTNVAKESKMKFINIDTRCKDDYESVTDSNHNITLPERYTEVRNISVMNAEIPLTYYNISSALGNNAFSANVNGTTTLVIVPDGEYTEATLKTEIDSGTSDLTIVIAKTSLIEHTADITTKLIIDFSVDDKGNLNRFGFKSSLGWLLGFRSPTYTFEGTMLTAYNISGLKSVGIVDLHGPRYLYLVIDEYTSSGNQSSFVSPLPNSLINKNILARISTPTQSFGSILHANLANGYLMSDVRSYTGKVDIQKLNVQLVNEFGKVINLNGGDFSFCLKIQHE